jgi:hypothetical protein
LTQREEGAEIVAVNILAAGVVSAETKLAEHIVCIEFQILR